MEEQLTELLRRINELSPMVYEAAYRQVYVNLVSSLITMTLFGIAIWLYIRFMKTRVLVDGFDPDDTPHLFIIAIVGGIILTIWLIIAIASLFDVVNILMNPQWQVIKLIGVLK